MQLHMAMSQGSWSVSVRHMWGLPLASHRYFIEALGGTHARTMMFTRFISFVQSIMKSQKFLAILLLQKVCLNVETVTGHNIRYILSETKKENIFDKNIINEIKKNYKFCQVNEEDKWKIGFIKDLVEMKHSRCAAEYKEFELTNDELDSFVEYLAT